MFNLDLKKKELFVQGHTLVPFLEHTSQFEFGPLIAKENWFQLDQMAFKLLAQGRELRCLLENFLSFSHTEHFISIRGQLQGQNPEEEDGIWHDDGSRVLAFSLSLTLETPLEGGILQIRSKSGDSSLVHSLPTPPYGQMIIFLTGVHGYEHRICKVERGRRVMLVGWCS